LTVFQDGNLVGSVAGGDLFGQELEVLPRVAHDVLGEVVLRPVAFSQAALQELAAPRGPFGEGALLGSGGRR
jgi:hypothetical protein